MVEKIIFIYSFCCDLLKRVGFVDDKQCKMTNAEVMTVAVVSVLYFQGNHGYDAPVSEGPWPCTCHVRQELIQ